MNCKLNLDGFQVGNTVISVPAFLKLEFSKPKFNGRGDPLRWPRDTLYPQKLALTSPTRGGRSVDIVRLRTTSHGVYNKLYCTQNYWVFVFFPSSGILENWKHDISETGYISVFRWGVKTPTQLYPLERVNLNHWTTPVRFTQLLNHLRTDKFGGR
jgi:hypothetical protein